MPADAYTTTIPGVSQPTGPRIPAPDLFVALAEPEESLRVKKLGDLATAAFEASRWYYQEAVECLANYYGAQWGYYSEPEGRYIVRPEPRQSDQVRVVVNLMKPIVDQATGILTQEEPIFVPLAATTEGQDGAVHESAKDFSEFIWRDHRLSAMYRLTARDGFLTGTAPVHLCWDPSDGPVQQDTANPFTTVKGAEYGQDGQLTADPVTEPNMVQVGDLRFTYLDREQIAFEPGCRSPLRSHYLVIREKWTRLALRSRFPDKWDLPMDRGEGDHTLDTTRAERASRGSPLGTSAPFDTPDQERVEVFFFYVRSCQDYPLGKLIVFSGGVELESGDNPKYPLQGEPDALWPKNPWPVEFVLCDDRGNDPWGRGRGVDMIGPQRCFNGDVSKTLQHVAKIANSKLAVPASLPTAMTDEQGQEIRYPRTMQPGAIYHVAPPSLPPEYLAVWDRLKGELEYIAGVNGSTMGQNQSNVESGRQAEVLIRRDYGRLDPVKRELDKTWGRLMLYALQLFRRHATTKRKVLIAGENHQTSIKFFDRATFSSEVDITVRNDQSIPRDPAQRSAFLANLASTMSQLTDPGTKTMMLELYRLRDFEPFLERMNPNQVKARRLCQRLMLEQPEPTPIFPGDDPLTFKAELERLAQSESFERRVESEGGEQKSRLFQMVMTYWTYYTAAAAGLQAEQPPQMPGLPTDQGAAIPPPAEPAAAAIPQMGPAEMVQT